METPLARWSIALVVLSGPPSAAHALTAPASGAVAKPADFDLRLPFANGESVYFSSGYSPSGGSSLHAGTDRTCCTNDYYALDFTLPAYADAGLGQPVLAVASGTVVLAGWSTSGWENYGQRIYIQHDYSADGHTYISLYAHLNAIDVNQGDHVVQGQQIGELGRSCAGVIDSTCFGTHLHFALHQDSSIGGSGTGGSYAGHAVVPELFDGYEDLHAGLSLTSHNNGQPPLPCQTIADAEVVLEENGPCFSRRGTAAYWHDESAGHDGHCLWTYTTAAASPDNHGYWLLDFAAAGRYTLAAYIPAPFGQSQQSTYRVRHAGTEQALAASQASAPDGWLGLGSFDFSAGGDQWLRLVDNTGEPYSAGSNTKIAFDALRVTPADAGSAPGDASAPHDANTPLDASAPPDASAVRDSSTQVDGWTTRPDSVASVDVVATSGCGCSHAGAVETSGAGVLGVALLGWRRRHRSIDRCRSDATVTDLTRYSGVR